MINYKAGIIRYSREQADYQLAFLVKFRMTLNELFSPVDRLRTDFFQRHRHLDLIFGDVGALQKVRERNWQ